MPALALLRALAQAMKLGTTNIGRGASVLCLLLGSAYGHGEMTEPKPRDVTDKYRADCYAGLRGAGNEELRYAPVENLSERKQADQPFAATFDVMNGCRGMIYEEENAVTELQYDTPFPVKWTVQAPHPGYMELSIVKPKTEDGGKIMYEKVETLLRIDDFQKSGDDGTEATIPSSVTGCDQPGNCVLQFYWHSDIASQTYPTCADIVIGGSGGAAPANPGPTPAPGSDPAPSPSATPAPPTSSEKTRCRLRDRKLRAAQAMDLRSESSP